MVTRVIDQEVSRRWSENIVKIEEIVKVMNFEELIRAVWYFWCLTYRHHTRSNNLHAKKIQAESLVAS